MSERQIQPVQSNLEKESTYRKNMIRYNQAIRSGFYYEAIMIDYAMIEDRLRSTLYHMGLLANRKATEIWKKNRPVLLDIVAQYKSEKEDLRLGIKTMEGKLRIVRCILLWASHTEGGYHDSKYLTVLKSQIERMDADAFLYSLDRVEAWKSVRNEIVHAMLNKNIDSLHIEKDSLEEEYYKNENHGLQVDYEGPSHYTPKPLRTITDYANPEDFVIEGKKLIWFRGAARNIVIPENVTIIGEKAFAGRAFIEHVFLHEHVTAIEDSAFELCDALQTINLPVSIKKIGEDVFSGCCSLKTICIPDSIKSLRDGLNRNFVYGAKQDVYLPPTIGSLASHAINTSCGMTYHVIAGSKIETILKNRRDKQSDSFAIDNDVGDAWTDNPLGEDPKLIARYHAAEKAVKTGQLRQAESIFRELMGFKDSRERASMCAETIRKETIAKKTKLLNEKTEQEKILAENKGLGAIFGEKAKKRKAAQQRLEEINKELERL